MWLATILGRYPAGEFGVVASGRDEAGHLSFFAGQGGERRAGQLSAIDRTTRAASSPTPNNSEDLRVRRKRTGRSLVTGSSRRALGSGSGESTLARYAISVDGRPGRATDGAAAARRPSWQA